jgi:hypothetical protein
MPAFDVVAELPYDLMNDAQFASVMVGMYSQKPSFTLLASPCTAYTAAMHFNSLKPKVMAKNRADWALQEQMMKRVNQKMRAAFTYGGEVMIENPQHSDYWKQAFIADFEKSLPDGRVWHDVELNMCRVGSPYFKAMRFRTTALGPVTAHMELKCNHEKRHSSCTERDASGVPRTKSTAAYTKDLLAMLITVATILAGLAMVSSMPSVGGEMLKMEDSFASEGRYCSGGVMVYRRPTRDYWRMAAS